MNDIPMNRITVLFFATFREYTGQRKATFDMPKGARVQDLRERLRAQFPQLEQRINSAVFSVNHQFAFEDDLLPDGAEAAIFPPVSGGTESVPPTWLAVTEEALDLNAILERITLPSTGAACIFTGVVRGITSRDNPHETIYLEYEAYRSMAKAKLRQTADEIRQRWPAVEGIAILQRVGRLYPKTPTVIVACTAAHRDTGVFDAARYGIDRLKEIVPVWKKEVSPDGEEWIEGEYIPSADD